MKPCCAASLQCLQQRGHRAQQIRVLQEWGSPRWPWDGQWCGVALLEALWALLLLQVGFTCPPEQVGQAGHHPRVAAEPRSSPFKASSALCTEQEGRRDLPQPKLQREERSGAFIAGTLSGREEQG